MESVTALSSLINTIATDAWHGPSPLEILNEACASLNHKPPIIRANETSHQCFLHHLGVKLLLSPRLSQELSAAKATELTAFLALLLVNGICSFESSSDICTVHTSSSRLPSSSQPHVPLPLHSHRMIRGLGLIHEEPEEDESAAAVADEVEGLGFRALGLKELPSDHDERVKKKESSPRALSGDRDVSKRVELMRRLERKRAKLEMKLAEIDAMKRSVMEGQLIGLPISGSKRARVAGTGVSGERSNSVNSLHYTKSARVAQQSGVRRVDSSFASPSDSEEDGSESSSSSLSSDPYDSGGNQGMTNEQQEVTAPSSSHVQGSNHPTPSPAPPSSHSPTNQPRHSFDPAYPSLPLSLDDPEPAPHVSSTKVHARTQSRTSSIHSSSQLAHASLGEGRGGDEKSKVQELKEMCDRMHWNQPVYSFSRTSASSFICELSLPPLPLPLPSLVDQPQVVKSTTQLTKKAAKEEVAALALQHLLQLS